MPPPSVSIVYVVYNRREELRESLNRMLSDSDYEGDVEAIVVDNASADGSADMVREEFPQVKLIARDENIGAPAWNDGYFAAKNDWVLTLDDDAYLPPDGLTKALAAAEEHDADLVSFKVASTADPDWVFTEKYRTGLFSFWGCAWLVKRPILQELGGYDPEIFMWANELEFTLRFLDRGHRHLHLPTIVAQHMKPPSKKDAPPDERGYRINARHFGYVAAKLLRPRDAFEALVALLVRNVRDGLREDAFALRATAVTASGFVHGLRHRQPVRNAELSRTYRRDFETFASPWRLARPLGDLVKAFPGETYRRLRFGEKRPSGIGRRQQFYDMRSHFYPQEPAVLDFASNGAGKTRRPV